MNEIGSLALLFVLGLRHGLDPDHVACIDGLTWLALERGRRSAPWTGSLFAFGHSAIVTALAVALCAFSSQWSPSNTAWQVAQWAPTVVLVFSATLNLRQLLGDTPIAGLAACRTQEGKNPICLRLA